MDKKKYEALCFRAKAGDILLKITRSEMEIGMKNVLFIASEAVPFIKTGGLADVVGALPKYFNKDEFDVRVMIPKYTCIPWEYREKMVYKTHFYIDLAWRTQYVGVFEMEYQGVTFYFIDNEFYFSGRSRTAGFMKILKSLRSLVKRRFRQFRHWDSGRILSTAMTGRQVWCRFI